MSQVDWRDWHADYADPRSQVDWRDWHADYADPRSRLAQRLALVQRLIADALDTIPPGALRAISVCAGQGHDILGVLATHPRAADVHARLVELDARNVRRRPRQQTRGRTRSCNSPVTNVASQLHV